MNRSIDPNIKGDRELMEEEMLFSGMPEPKAPWYRRMEMPFILIGLGLVAFLVGFVFLFPKATDKPQATGAVPGDLTVVMERLDAMASDIAEIKKMQRNNAILPRGNEETLEAVRKLAADMNLQLAALSKKIKQMPAVTPKKTTPASSPQKASVGKKESVPVKEKKASQKKKIAGKPLIYVVKKGDTLYGISKKNGVSIRDILRANNLRKGDAIYPGQRLKMLSGS